MYLLLLLLLLLLKSVKFYATHVNSTKFLYSSGENCIFILKLFNRTADEYDDLFTSGCNSIVCLNRWLNRRLTERVATWWGVLHTGSTTAGAVHWMFTDSNWFITVNSMLIT